MDHESFLDLLSIQSMYATRNTILSIGSGTLYVDDAELFWVCDDLDCSWIIGVKYTMIDIYSFSKLDDHGERMNPLVPDNNLVFRWLPGKDFIAVDTKFVVYSGEMPCRMNP